MEPVRYLLDTHAFLWWSFDSADLSQAARALIADPSNEILFSSASAWEIATKFRIGRLPEAAVLVQDIAGWVRKAGMSELPVTLSHAQRAGLFAQEHRDPFDRMLAAQGLIEQVPIIGNDAALRTFGASLVW